MGTLVAICLALFFIGRAFQSREVFVGRVFWSFFAFISLMYLVT